MLNLSTLKTPGVYIDEVSLLPPSVAGVETGVPAFVGHTQKALTAKGKDLTDIPTKIKSIREYEDYFGGSQAEDDGLKITVSQTVNNTDSTKVISQTLSTPEPVADNLRSRYIMRYALELYFANGGGPCYIVSVGDYSGSGPDPVKLKGGIDALAAEDEPTMIVVPEAVYLGTNLYTLMDTALQQAALLKDRFVIIDVPQNLANTAQADITAFRSAITPNNCKFGAAYYPYLETTIDFNFAGKEDKVEVTIKNTKENGTPETDIVTHLADSTKVSNLLKNAIKQKLAEVPMTLPPSAAMAGIYAKTDAERGVWKSPANVGISYALGPSRKLDDNDNDMMNVTDTGKSVNALRMLTGRGFLVWGARTLDSNDLEWRYISVRRFFNFVEESVKKATYRFVFEPNDANTWVKVRAMIENFLILQWRAGALQGAKPEQAFFVKVGLGQTMTPDDVLSGRLIVEIGMAVVRPAEFIVLRFMHKTPEA